MRRSACPRPDAGDDRFVVTVELDAPRWPMVPPRCTCRDDCVELLELDGLLLVFARPSTLYPSLLHTVEGAESPGAAGVSVQTELGGLRPCVVEEERPAVPVVEEDIPPLDIGSACSVESYPIEWLDLWMVVLGLQVPQTTHKGAAGYDNSCCERELAQERSEVRSSW